VSTAAPDVLANPEFDTPCVAPTDPTGFIYGSYRAAGADAQGHRPSLEVSHQGVAHVSSSVGGSVSTLSFENAPTGNRVSTRSRQSGGFRDKVRSFSKASRRNLLRRLASIDRGAFRAFGGRVFFATLTYPHVWPEDPEECKGHLKAFRKRLQREYVTFAAFWRMSVQHRGAWHFHLPLVVGPSVGPLKGLRRFVSSSWYEVTGKLSEGHLRAGTRVEAVRRWKDTTSHAERYVAKPKEFPAGSRTGRVWGVWNGRLLPVRWEKVEIALRDAFRIRRTYRKLARRKGGGALRRVTVFVRYENAMRLLGFLGYRL
jgi:hypothetical protein